MKIETKELRDILKSLAPLTRQNPILYSNIVLKDGRIAATDGELSISHPFDSELGDCAISPAVLSKFLARVSGEHTTIQRTETDEGLIFRSGRQRATILSGGAVLVGGAAGEFWPAEPGDVSDPSGDITDAEWVTFCAAVRKVLPCAAKEGAGRPGLSNIHLTKVGSALYVEASDGRILARLKAGVQLPAMSISARVVPPLLHANAVRWYQDANSVTFVSDGDVRYTVRKRSEVAPNFGALIPEKSSLSDHEVLTFPDMEDVLKNAALMGDAAAFSVESDSCTVTAKSSLGEYAAKVDVESTGDVKFSFNPHYLGIMLGMVSTLHVPRSGSGPFVNVDGSEAVIAMPLRPE